MLHGGTLCSSRRGMGCGCWWAEQSTGSLQVAAAWVVVGWVVVAWVAVTAAAAETAVTAAVTGPGRRKRPGGCMGPYQTHWDYTVATHRPLQRSQPAARPQWKVPCQRGLGPSLEIRIPTGI